MQILGKRFRQTVGNRFHHDLVIVVVLRFVSISQIVFFKTAGDCESTDVIRFSAQFRRDKIRQTVVGKTDFLGLLAQVVADRQNMSTGFVAINFDVIANAVRREQAHHATRIQQFLGAQFIQHIIGVFKQTLRLNAHHLIFQNARVFAGQRPGHKERRPVDVVAQSFDAGFHLLHAQTVGYRRGVAFPIECQIIIARRLQRDRRRTRFFAGVLNTHGFVLFAGTGDKVIALGVGE